MWSYKNISRSGFESRKEFVDIALRDLGCSILKINLTYEQKTTTLGTGFDESWISERPIYQYGSHYFRIDEVLFPKAPFIVIGCADALDQVMKNIMEDAEPFPYNLSDEEIMQELKYVLGIETYPNSIQ